MTAAEVAKGVSTTSALLMTAFTSGGPQPSSLFLSRSNDEINATLPCLFPFTLWDNSFSLVSGAGASLARSLPTMRFRDDYDTTTRHVCYLAPVIEKINPAAAKVGEVVTITGRNFGATSPKVSKSKVALIGEDTFLTIGSSNNTCATFGKWEAETITFTLCEGFGSDLPLALFIGDYDTSQGFSTLSYTLQPITCDAGWYTGAMPYACAKCPPGRHGLPVAGETLTCDKCGLGYYAGAFNQTKCSFCAANRITGLEDTATNCSVCPAGAIRDDAAIFCTTCVAGQYRDRTTLEYTCKPCKDGSHSTLPIDDACMPCLEGAVPDASRASCVQCAVKTYAAVGDVKCSTCGADGMDCAGGVLKLVKGWWYDSARSQLLGTTTVYPCLNPSSCSTVNNTIVECAANAMGPMCAVCEEGYVPDTEASDGRCKPCESTPVERWLSKFALLACAAAVFFTMGLIVLSRPAPSMKIDALLRVLHARRIFRRFRKRTLRRMIEAERSAADTGISDAYYARCIQLLDDDNIDATALLYSRRDASAAHAVGLAAATASTSMATASGEDHSLTTIAAHAAEHIGEQALHTLEDRVIGELSNIAEIPDVEGSLANDAVRRTSL